MVSSHPYPYLTLHQPRRARDLGLSCFGTYATSVAGWPDLLSAMGKILLATVTAVCLATLLNTAPAGADSHTTVVASGRPIKTDEQCYQKLFYRICVGDDGQWRIDPIPALPLPGAPPPAPPAPPPPDNSGT